MTGPVSEVWRLIARLRREHGIPATSKPASHRVHTARHKAGNR